MPFEVVECPIRRRDHLEVEALEQGARPIGVGFEQRRNMVVEPVGIGFRQQLIEPEQRRKRMVEPHPGRRAAEQVVVLRKQPPDCPAIRFDRRTVHRRHAKILEPHPLREQHPEDVVVRHDEQPRRIGELLVFGIPPRFRVPMGRNQRQVAYARIECPCDATLLRVGREQPVVVEMHHEILPRRPTPGTARNAGAP